MTIHSRRPRHAATAGFSMVEMIGVLSVIAILSSMLVPKVFETITSAKINATASNYSTVKTALIDHYAKFGSFASSNGIAFTPPSGGVSHYDFYLVAEGLLERPFDAKIGDGGAITLRATTASATAVNVGSSGTAANSAYWLSGTGATNSNETGTGSYVVECVLTNVPVQDAVVLNERVDGPQLGTTSLTVGDSRGRVKYAAPTAGVTTIYMYLAHR